MSQVGVDDLGKRPSFWAAANPRKALAVMDAVTQQNAALVEQASAARPDHAPVKAGPL